MVRSMQSMGTECDSPSSLFHARDNPQELREPCCRQPPSLGSVFGGGISPSGKGVVVVVGWDDRAVVGRPGLLLAAGLAGALRSGRRQRLVVPVPAAANDRTGLILDHLRQRLRRG